MADDIVTISFSRKLFTDARADAATHAGRVSIDHTTNTSRDRLAAVLRSVGGTGDGDVGGDPNSGGASWPTGVTKANLTAGPDGFSFHE